MRRIEIYDTTLRDGTQGEGIAFTALDKIRIARRMDQIGYHYIEGGWPGSNPRDMEFFELARKERWKRAKITAFGSTRRGHVRVSQASWKRRIYSLTPEGIAHKLHLTVAYIDRVLNHYHNVRHTLREEMETLAVNEESSSADSSRY